MKQMFVLLTLTAVFTAGCGQPGADVAEDQPTDSQQAATSEAKSEEVAAAGHGAHGGWWCTEHGIPEEECSMCSAKAAEKFKAAGDWCEEHNRAESQCFICHPERKEHYAMLYRAKIGKEPPEIKE